MLTVPHLPKSLSNYIHATSSSPILKYVYLEKDQDASYFIAVNFHVLC